MNNYRTHNCGELSKENIGKKVIISGWLNKKRDHGKLLFLDIDSTSVTFISLTIAKMIPGNPAPLPISNREPRSISLDKI